MLTLGVLQWKLKHNYTQTSQGRCHDKLEHDIIHPSHCWSKLVPIPQIIHKAKHQAKSGQCLSLPKSSLKTESLTRLSITILSKTDPIKGIQQPHIQICWAQKGSGFTFAEKLQRVCPYFKFQLSNSSCINHSKYAPIFTNMVEELISSNHIWYHHCSTSYSMQQRNQAVSIFVRNGRF